MKNIKKSKHLLVRFMVILVSTILASCKSGNTTNSLNIENKNITLGMQNINYYQIQSQPQYPSLILLTGVGTTTNYWSRTFLTCLSANHNVYLIDYPGINSEIANGGSISVQYFADIVNQFTKQLNINNPELVGWSMGGSVALQAAFNDPSLYQKLYLLAAYVPTGSNILLPFPPPPTSTNDTLIMNYVLYNNLYNYQPQNLGYYNSQFILPGVSNLFPSYAYTLSEIATMQSWGDSSSVVNQFLTSQIPVLFIIPDNDTIINESEALMYIKKYNSIVSIIQIQNSGHDVSLQIPYKVCDDIK